MPFFVCGYITGEIYNQRGIFDALKAFHTFPSIPCKRARMEGMERSAKKQLKKGGEGVEKPGRRECATSTPPQEN